MSYAPPPNQPDNFTPNYAELPPRTSGMAMTAMILGIVGLVLSIFVIGIPIGLTGLILGIVAFVQINKRPRELAGTGFAITGMITGGLSMIFAPALLIAILLPSLGKARELSNRSYCAANMRGIMQSCAVYSSENSDLYPTVKIATPNTYTVGLGNASGNAGTILSNDATYGYYGSASVQQGNPVACLWILALRGQISPKQLICKSDPLGKTPAQLMDSTGNSYNNVYDGSQISYSIAMPWQGTSQAPYWKALTDSSLPLMSDMALEASNNTPGNPKNLYNSSNHSFDGQNVGFGDVHVEFLRKVDIGQMEDNIFLLAANSSAGYAGNAIGAATYNHTTAVTPRSTNESAPFDIFMVPVRTAGWRGTSTAVGN